MIIDARAFDDDYPEVDLVHRDSEINHLVSLLEPIAAGGIPHDVLVTGPSGVGKSTTTRTVLEELEKSALDVDTAYADAISHSPPTKILDALLTDLGIGYDLSASHASTSDYLDRIREHDNTLVLAIDELDVLDDKRILATLYEIPDVHLVGICISQDHLFTDDLDIRVEDRLRNFKHVPFDAYRYHELQDITQSRADAAFARPQDAITHDATDEIADRASATGNARLAVGLLSEGATHANRNTSWPITTDVVDEIAADARREVATRYVDKLGTHQKILYEIVRDHGDLAAGDLHDTYEERASTPKSRPTRRNYLQALQREGLISKEGATRSTRYLHTGPR